LDEYSYNHKDLPKSECVPSGYFFDLEEKKIKECNSENSKFYIEITTNKKIWFKPEYACPKDYPIYNITTKECQSNQTIDITTIEIEASINPCSIEDFKNDLCLKFNYTNDDINEKIKDILKEYSVGDKSIEIKGQENTVFQLTSTENEHEIINGNKSENKGLSLIDLGNCENLLKEAYKIDKNISLIIKKYEKIVKTSERNVQYEIYHPINKYLLNLSICDSEIINLYIPTEISDKLIDQYNDLEKYGYDLFNINDRFYTDICTPYKSKNGTDVSLSDRKNDYYNNNYTTCQSNCKYSSFDLNNKLLKCDCSVIDDEIEINNLNKFTKKIYKSFYDILKYSNYKVLKCYKLVFNIDYFKKNLGSFVFLLFMVIFLSTLFFYIIKGISPIKEEAKSIIFKKFKNINENNYDKTINFNDNGNNKKQHNKNHNNKRKNSKLNNILHKKNEKSKNIIKRKTINQNDIKIQKYSSKNVNNKRNFQKSKSISISKTKNKIINIDSFNTHKGIFEHIKKNETNKNLLSKEIKEMIKPYNKNIILDDLELNNISYDDSIYLDKRNCFEIYKSKILKKHLILYTFCAFNDHNLIYIKIARFIFLVCTNMAMSVLFFSDGSMHKIYLDYGKYNFIQQISESLYSSIVTLVIEILIGFLTFTDIHIYQIRKMTKYNCNELSQILKLVKIKLVIFFILTNLFLDFYWYLISAFCAVYNNTQIIYMEKFLLSFLLGLLYPCGIQLFLSFIRICSLKKKTKFRSFLFKVA
jgi:hypothetical protein